MRTVRAIGTTPTDRHRLDGDASEMIHGAVAAGWEPVRRAFARVIELDDAGAAVAVVRDGRTVVDLWGGADPESGAAWRSDSVVLTFSTAKGVLALLTAMEVQAGALDPDAPVARYWPEFAQAGKSSITVRDLLTHVAGLPVLPMSEITDLFDPTALAARLAAEAPAYPPRTAWIYHALSYGTLVGELLRRTTGLGINELVHQRVATLLGRAGPGSFGGSMWFGVPASEDHRRRDVLMEPIEPPAAPTTAAEACVAGYRASLQVMPLLERVGGQAGTEPMNSGAFLRAQVGGAGLVSDARSLARMYGACVADVDGVRLLDRDTAAFVASDQLRGISEPACTTGAVPTTRWGLGFEISHHAAPMLGEGSFGHAGMGGALSFASIPHRLGFSFVGQRMQFTAPGGDRRWQLLLSAVRAALTG